MFNNRRGRVTMKGKPKKSVQPTLHRGELVPVTDPAEFAALERRVRAAMAAEAANGKKPTARK
jgi:hypothetical protein